MSRKEEPVEFKKEELPLVLDLNGKKIGVLGYYINDIESHLTEEEFKSFNEFMRGQTVGVVKCKTIVYQWDYERWEEQYKCISQ